MLRLRWLNDKLCRNCYERIRCPYTRLIAWLIILIALGTVLSLYSSIPQIVLDIAGAISAAILTVSTTRI